MRQYHVVYKDGSEHDVDIGPFDIVATERRFGLSIVAIEKDVHLEHSYFLAWSAERQRDEKLPEFDDWLKSLASFEVSVADPTPAPKTGPSRTTSTKRRSTSASRASQ